MTFNENLASFIGDKGAELFLEAKYGRESAEVGVFKSRRADEERFKNYMLRASQSLDSAYKAMENEPVVEKKRLKDELIAQVKQNLDTVAFESDRYTGYFENFTPNNTFFMSFLRYNSQLDLLEAELNTKFDGDLKRYLIALKQTYPSI